MFAVDNDYVDENDIVMTVDINLFVMSEKIIAPILDSPRLVAWVPLYDDVNTFGLSLIAMKAAFWRDITGYKGSLEDLVRLYREEVGLEELVRDTSSWDTDQLITQVPSHL